jgi:catechol 2,3-dioxygenase-like lactoylglutathione lyase family enzyme
VPEINAITLLVTDMARSVGFYEDIGLTVAYGGADAEFTSLSIGTNYVNLSGGEGPPAGFWGRVVFHVDDPDAVHARATAAGHRPEFEPRDAPWNERYFHLRDPDGHELSFARPL